MVFNIAESFVGCLKNIRIRDNIISPVEHIYGCGNSHWCESSHYVTVGQCQLTDWCALFGSPCLSGGRCEASGSSTVCECADDYSGDLCQYG